MSTEPYLVVDPADVLRRLGTREPTEDQLDDATDAILDAQGDVEAELNRPLSPRQVVLADQYPLLGAVDVTDWRSWAPPVDDDFVVVSATPTGAGAYTLTLSVGLNARAERPIIRFITAAAVTALRNRPEGGYGQREVSSLSAEGQSISYAKTGAAAGSGEAGAPPVLASLVRYKRRSFYKANSAPQAPWPYSGSFGWR